VSARSDGLLSTATFDNVTLTGSPVLQGRTIGFVNVQGTDDFASGVYTVSGSGAQIGGTGDECHFVAAPVIGDFILTARVLSQSGGAPNAQAGVMVRELPDFRARSIYAGLVANAGSELITRNTTATGAYGDGVDFTLPAGTLTFNIGDTTRNIPLVINNDSIPEPDEQITVLLRNASGAQLGTQTTFTYTIIDDDTPPVLPSVGFASTAVSALENSGTASVLVSLSAPSTSSVTVDYSVTAGTATAGADFTTSAGTLTFAPGELVKSIAVPLIDDSIVEPSETVLLTISNPSGAVLSTQNTATLTILDDDTPTVSIAATTPSVPEAGPGTGVFTFTRLGSLSGALTVNFTRSGTATSGTDYTAIATPGSVTIPNGQASATLNVTPIQDTLNEGTETVIITLASGSYTIGSANTATVNILDDDRSTVNITATIANASETAGHPGQFTITRTAPTTASLTVNLSISGTATNGTDYTTIATTATIAAGQTSVLVNVSPIDDAITEGPESVILTLNSGSYNVGTNNFASVIIADNDSPPTLFISSPTAQGPLIASGNGLIVGCTVSDDGAPQPVTLAWSQVSGPGTATFAAPTAAISPVTFSANGVYVLKVTATDGQFTVSDQVTVIVGSSAPPADWIAQDMSPIVSLRGQSQLLGTTYTLIGTGTGYTSTADAAHVMVKQITGDGTVIARLSSISGATAPLAGVTIRDTLFRGATRAVLGYVPGTGLQYRTRTTINTADTVTTQAGVTLPIWLKLDRNSTTNAITASYAADAGGAPGTWNVISAPVISMDSNAEYGLTATSNLSTATTAATFDNVSLSPSPAGPTLLTEDIGSSNALAGSYAYNTGTYTISASGSLDGSGYFAAQQYYGDIMVTAKLTSASSGSPNAHAGIMIRESMDSGGYAFIGRNPTSSFSGYIWRTLASGSTGGIPTFTGTVRWIRLIRQGNSMAAYHAPDNAGAPGTWVQIGQPQTIIMTTPVLAGLAVDNAGLGTLNTATFTNFSVVPLNKAPIIDAGNFASSVTGPVPLAGSVSDDNFPAPPAVTTQWSAISGPGTATFGNAAATSTTASFSIDGTYTLRLRASDGSVETFDDVTLTAYATPFTQWQSMYFAGGSSNPDAAPMADPDQDGIVNLLEYAYGTSPVAYNLAPLTFDTETVGGNRYLRLTMPKNPNATDLLYQVEAANSVASPASWSASGLIIETNTSTTLRVRDNVPMSGTGSRFMHVLINKP